MNSNDLKIFAAAAELGSFTKAAEETFTVQSNVTARIKSLEQEFDTELFTKSGRKAVLTDSGRILLGFAKQMELLIENAKAAVKNGDDIGGKLRIGCIETTMALKAPSIINNFSELYPKVDLEFSSANVSVLIRNVLEQNLDAAYIAGPVHLKGLKQVKIAEEDLVLVSSKDSGTITELLKQPELKVVVFDQGCFFRARLEAWLTAKGIAQYKLTVVNSIEGIINFVEAGLGLSILPSDVVNHYYKNRDLKTYPLQKELGRMTTLLVYRDDVEIKNSLQAYIDQSFNLI